MKKLSFSRYIQLTALLTIFLVIFSGASCSDGGSDGTDSLSISNVKVSETTATTAVIAWTTNVPATSEVIYDCNTLGGSPEALLDKKLVISHSITLSELIPGTTYCFKVSSTDDADNKALSEEETFTTTFKAESTDDADNKAPSSGDADTAAPEISDVTIYDITENRATISWTTDEPATSNVKYGPDTDYGYSFPSPPDSSADKTSHILTLSGLSPETVYTFRIESADNAGNKDMSEYFSFTTGIQPDTTAPEISDITVSNITETTAAISWNTDEPATGNIDYCCDTECGCSFPSPSDSSADKTSHSLTLSGLSPGTTYQFRVKSEDADGNGSISANQSFTTAPVSVNPVIFPDANLEEAIREAIGKSQGDIYTSDLAALTVLDAGRSITDSIGESITDLTGLEHCSGLTELNLSRNQISNLSPISTLTGLTELNLYGNRISDISPLYSLTGLTGLNLGSNNISDISPLSSLTGLTELNLGSNEISNISSLSTLTGLIKLILYDNQISNLSPISTLTGLTSLNLYGNQISDISPLSSLTALTTLDINGNQISNLSPLSSLTSLTELYLGSNQISDIEPLSSLTGLTVIQLNGNLISDIEPLVNNSGLGQGDTINLRYNPLSGASIDIYIPALGARGVSVSY